MSLNFLPSYLRTWIETETSCEEEPCDLQETIDQEYDWVLVDYRKDESKGKQSKDLLLQDYVVIEGQENARKEDDAWVDVGEKTSRCSSGSERRAWKRARRSANRHSPYLGIPFKFTKLPTHRISPRLHGMSGVSVPVKIDSRNECFPPNTSSMKQYETEKSIVPFCAKNHHGVPEMLRVFQDLGKRTSAVIICCDFAQLNSLNVCTTRDLICVKNSHQVLQNCRVTDVMARDQYVHPDNLACARDKCMVSEIMSRDQRMLPNVVTRDQCMCSDSIISDQRMFPRMIPADLDNRFVLPYHEALTIEKNDEDVFQDCIDPTSKIFSLTGTSESLYSKIYTTKKKLEDLLRSVLLLHLVVGKKLQSWKETTISNIAQLSTGYHTPAPHYDVAKSFVSVPEKSRGYASEGHVTGKQLRRQSRMATRNSVVNSNRQRGMKCGRFQNNVGHRESWHK